MSRYAIWNKTDDIYTIAPDKNGKMHFTAQEYISEKAAWAANPAVKVIVGGGAINGTVFMEFGAAKQMYAAQGAAITDDMSDAQVLAAIEAFEDAPSAVEPSAEERSAAALEFIALNSL